MRLNYLLSLLETATVILLVNMFVSITAKDANRRGHLLKWRWFIYISIIIAIIFSAYYFMPSSLSDDYWHSLVIVIMIVIVYTAYNLYRRVVQSKSYIDWFSDKVMKTRGQLSKSLVSFALLIHGNNNLIFRLIKHGVNEQLKRLNWERIKNNAEYTRYFKKNTTKDDNFLEIDMNPNFGGVNRKDYENFISKHEYA